MKVLECPKLQIHKYYEDIDETKCHLLNEELIHYISILGWDIKEKIGEGGTADVFTVKKKGSNLEAALIIQGNLSNEDYSLVDKIEFANKHPDIFPTVYNYFQVDIPYSLELDYVGASENFGSRTIQIMEKMDMTLEEFFERAHKALEKDKFKELVGLIKEHTLSILSKMYENGVTYTDLKFDNLAIKYDGCKVKFLDIAGIFMEKLPSFDPNHGINRLFYYNLPREWVQ